MLIITVPGVEHFDEANATFMTVGDTTLELEHSLASLSKWESIYEKPFLNQGEKTEEEILGYIKAMVLTPDVPPEVFLRLSEENVMDINAYLNAKMTATWFREEPTARSSEILTAELIYHWMIEFGIPFECENWHLSRLFTLIKVRNAKLAKPKKLSPAEAASQRQALNEQRRKELGTKG